MEQEREKKRKIINCHQIWETGKDGECNREKQNIFCMYKKV
jgi:hypothetical protein